MRSLTDAREFPTRQWTWLFITLHVVAWTLAPSLLRHALPLDAMESVTWGHQLEWGYDKNPYFVAWLTELAVVLGGKSGWLVYGFSQACVAACFYSVWRLGSKIFNPYYGLAAVLLLEGMQYYHFAAIDFDDNVISLGIWAWLTYRYYQALTEDRWRDWLAVGVWLGLALMTKYSALLLAITMLYLYLTEIKQPWRRGKFYSALLVTVLICVPHLWWLQQHHFVTINYALGRMHASSSWLQHIVRAGDFLSAQLLTLIVPLALILLLLASQKGRQLAPRPGWQGFSKRYLLTMALLPCGLTLGLAFMAGIQLHPMWGAPFVTFWGLCLLGGLRPRITEQGLMRLMMASLTMLVLLLVAYWHSLKDPQDVSSAQFPAAYIAQHLTDEWHHRYHRHLDFVAGSRYLAGAIAYYSADAPATYIEWDSYLSPWIAETALKQSGGIFVWEITPGEPTLPATVHKRYPNLTAMHIAHYHWWGRPSLPPIEIGIAFLPPKA